MWQEEQSSRCDGCADCHGETAAETFGVSCGVNVQLRGVNLKKGQGKDYAAAYCQINSK